MKVYIPEDSPFLAADTRKQRWAVPYHFECVNARIDHLLGKNKDAIAGKRVLDIGSHIGTFAYAAHTLGAEFVHGIDVEARTVSRCRELFAGQGVPESACRFETAEVFSFLENAGENRFDTVLCFGMLYYTADPYRLLSLMRRAARETVLIDTFTAAYAAVQGKDAPAVLPAVGEAALDLPLMVVSLTQPDKGDYRLPLRFPHRGKELSLLSLPTQALFEVWFRCLHLDHTLLDWSEYAPGRKSHRELVTPEQKKNSHWADVYTSGIRVSYRLGVSPSGGGDSGDSQ